MKNPLLRIAHAPSALGLLMSLTLIALPLDARADEDTALEVNLPRIEAAVEIDGTLDEAVWTQAAVVDGFYQYLPVDGRPAEDSTTVLIWYSPTAIHFGIRAYATHGEVRATLADRDKIEGDDYIQILLDTFHDQRQAYVIGVNPLGAQADGILRDAARRAGMMGDGGGGAYSIDLRPRLRLPVERAGDRVWL